LGREEHRAGSNDEELGPGNRDCGVMNNLPSEGGILSSLLFVTFGVVRESD
jgi:hypothetical protein